MRRGLAKDKGDLKARYKKIEKYFELRWNAEVKKLLSQKKQTTRKHR